MKTKRWMSFILAAALLALACLTLSACGASYNKIRYGKAYRVVYDSETRKGYISYVFKANGTGTLEARYTYTPSYDSTPKVYSVTTEFEWREASDGAVHLFGTKCTFGDDHTGYREDCLIVMPIYFSDEFFTYTSHSQYGAGTVTYILEGSKLEKKLNED